MLYSWDVNPIVSIPGFSDPFSSIVHLLGAGLFAFFAPRLIVMGKNVGRRLALGGFALACPLLLVVSGTYHALPHESPARAVFRRLDHAVIFVLIAGSCAVGHAILFRGRWRWIPIVLIWLIAGVGVILKLFFFEHVSEGAGLIFYLGMGWIGIISGYRVWSLYGGKLFRPLFLGGMAYTVGAVLEFLRWPTPIEGVVGPHELFHLAVLAGVGFHWHYVLRFADGALDSDHHGASAIGSSATVPPPARP